MNTVGSPESSPVRVTGVMQAVRILSVDCKNIPQATTATTTTTTTTTTPSYYSYYTYYYADDYSYCYSYYAYYYSYYCLLLLLLLLPLPLLHQTLRPSPDLFKTSETRPAECDLLGGSWVVINGVWSYKSPTMG